jgi:hypothetical protein
MSFAGFSCIQMGYESPSNNLLKKIHKKNTFASNVFFIKWCLFFGFKILNPHVIRNLLEETNDDIIEGIKNLYYLRFFLDNTRFKHHMVNLRIAKKSPYYKTACKQGLINKYQNSSISNFLPSNYINTEDQFVLFFDNAAYEYNRLWDIFNSIESFYLKNSLSYQLLDCGMFVRYEEYCNNELIKKIDINGLERDILEKCNRSSKSLNILKESLELTTPLSTESIKESILSLKKEGLLYCNSELSEIISVINTDLIIT